jgi:beta-glucanase (GH16 family)
MARFLNYNSVLMRFLINLHTTCAWFLWPKYIVVERDNDIDWSIDIVAYSTVAKRWLCKQRPLLRNGLENNILFAKQQILNNATVGLQQ